MWTRCVYILCLLLICRAQLEDFEIKFNKIIKESNKTTAIENNMATPIGNNKATPIGNKDTTRIGNSKTCAIDVSTKGVCKKRSECDLYAPKIDPATNFNFRAAVDKNTQDPCGLLKICCPIEKVKNENHVVKKVSKPLGCGYSNPAVHEFVESSTVYDYADFGEFPWMIALFQKRNNGLTFNYEYIGGGALIHPSVVITVAHKVFNMIDQPDKFKCRAGEWDITMEDELYNYQEQDVTDIVVHSKFVSSYAHYDVALLILKSPFDLNIAPHIDVACLELNLPPPGTVCYGMGWGTHTNGTKYANVLKKIKLQLVGAERCQYQLRNTRLGEGYTLHSSLTCAGGKAGVDTCLGDGGSPLVCSIPGGDKTRHSVVGLVAYGVDCGKENLPGVYVKVPEIYDWVIKKMNLRGFNYSSFVY